MCGAARRGGRRTGPAAPLLIYAHGNGELIDMRAQEFVPLRDAGLAVMLVEFPGYGRSAGSPSEESVTAALVTAYDWATASKRFDAQRIVGYGRSLGGGARCDHAECRAASRGLRPQRLPATVGAGAQFPRAKRRM